MTKLLHDIELDRRLRLGQFFRAYRIEMGMSEEETAEFLELESVDILRAYENGALSMPLEDVFALTNILNISPEEVMDLVHTLYTSGAV